MHHDHGPENGEGHARSREQADQGQNGTEKRDAQGNERQYTIEPDWVLCKAIDQHKDEQSQQHKDDGTTDDIGEPACIERSQELQRSRLRWLVV